MCLSSSQTSPSLSHPNLVSSSTNTHKPSSSSTNTHKTSSSKMKPHPKQLSTTNNPTDLSNQPQLTFTYPRSASSLPPPQPQHTISPLTQSSFHPSSPSRNNLRILQWNANGIRPRRTELIQFVFLNQYNFIFVQDSHLSSDSTFHINGYKTFEKNRSMTKRGTTDSTGNLQGGVLILVKNGLTYSPSLLNSFPPSIPAPII